MKKNQTQYCISDFQMTLEKNNTKHSSKYISSNLKSDITE